MYAFTAFTKKMRSTWSAFSFPDEKFNMGNMDCQRIGAQLD